MYLFVRVGEDHGFGKGGLEDRIPAARDQDRYQARAGAQAGLTGKDGGADLSKAAGRQ